MKIDRCIHTHTGSGETLTNELPRRKQRGIRCHARLDPASSFWIPAFAGMTIRRKRRGIEPQVIKAIFKATKEVLR
ncbi:MAG: hypothetical protein PHV74_04945 [Dehalococcoidia bacterium]|nr:hypothetical protein [Dehalococcoidia bacterium]